jgi:hypothetical protein
LTTIIALLVATTEVNQDEYQFELSIVEEDRGDETVIHVNLGPVDRATGLPDHDSMARIAISNDLRRLDIVSNLVTLDPVTACLLTCATSTVVDIIIKCKASAKSMADLIRCLRKNGVSLIGDAIKCAASVASVE